VTADALTDTHRDALLDVAVDSITTALFDGRRCLPDPSGFDPALRAPAATFVTLEDGDSLLGCIGSIEASRPLVVDVATHAIAAAFDDPRLPPLTHAEFARMSVHISVLSPLEPVVATTCSGLAAALRPGVDGVLVEAGAYCATFLPSVWDKVGASGSDGAEEFLALLWRKAGLPPGSWPADLRVRRYTCEGFTRAAAG
jgi:AmmeMemoRadiSam system protein A